MPKIKNPEAYIAKLKKQIAQLKQENDSQQTKIFGLLDDLDIAKMIIDDNRKSIDYLKNHADDIKNLIRKDYGLAVLKTVEPVKIEMTREQLEKIAFNSNSTDAIAKEALDQLNKLNNSNNSENQ